MPSPNRHLNTPILQKVTAVLPRLATGTVALAAIYAYVYGWDESNQIVQAKRDAQTASRK